MGFATLILAMKKSPKFIIARVQGTPCDRLAEQLGGFLQGTDWSAAGGA